MRRIRRDGLLRPDADNAGSARRAHRHADQRKHHRIVEAAADHSRALMRRAACLFTRGGPVLLGIAALLLATGAHAAPMTFKLASKGPSCRYGICAWIAADGDITADTPEDFVNFLHSNGINGNTWLVINSPGGDLAAAYKLFWRLGGSFNVRVGESRDIEGGKAQSFSGGVCNNECILVLMSGVKREVSDGSQVVVSQSIRPTDRLPDETYSELQ